MTATPNAAPRPAVTTPPVLERIAGWSFVLLCAVLPWAIAPISIALTLCSALTLAAWARSRSGLPWTPVLLPGLGWLAALALSAAFALDTSASWPRVDKGLLPLLVPLAAWHARSEPVARRALGALLVAAAIAAAAGVVEFALGPGGLVGRARGPVGHYMTFGGQLLLLIAAASGIALLVRGRRWRLLAGAVVVLGLAALAATFTRSAWLGLGVALALMVAMVRPRLLPWLAAAMVLAAVAAPPAFRDRLVSSFDPHHPHNRERTYMWQAGARMFREDPLTGVGLQDLQPLFGRYWPAGALERAGHLHSVPIQIAATMGVPGLVAFAWLFFGLVACAATGLRRQLAAGGLAAGLRLGLACGLAGFLVAGLFEWNFGDEELLELVYVLAGIAWGLRPAAPGEAA